MSKLNEIKTKFFSALGGKPKKSTSEVEEKNQQSLKQKTEEPKETVEKKPADTSGVDKNKKTFITVEKKKYAVGLFWQPFKDEKANKAEVLLAANSITNTKMNVFCMKEKGLAQYCLASTLEGYKAGLIPAAIPVSDYFADGLPTLAIFKVKEGWWIVIIRDGIILPDEDKLYTDEDEARKAFNAMLVIPDWGHIVAPEEWSIEGGKFLSIEEVFKSYNGADKLKNIGKDQKPVFIAIAVFAVIGFFVYKHMEKKKVEKLQQSRRSNNLKKKARLKKQKIEKEEKQKIAAQEQLDKQLPWKGNIDPFDLYIECSQSVHKLLSPFAGWSFQGIFCSKSKITATWKKKYGFRNWIFKAQQLGYIDEKMRLSVNGKEATGILDLKDLQKYDNDPLANIEVIQKDLNKFFDENKFIRGKIEIEEKNISAGSGRFKIDKRLNYLKFSVDSKEQILSILKVFGIYGGFVINSIEWSKKSKKWTYKGEIYGK